MDEIEYEKVQTIRKKVKNSDGKVKKIEEYWKSEGTGCTPSK